MKEVPTERFNCYCSSTLFQKQMSLEFLHHPHGQIPKSEATDAEEIVAADVADAAVEGFG